MRLKHIGIIATLALTASLNAQELKQEITLDKDFVPVEKKATKKNTLPDATPITTTGNSKISFSEWAVPTKLNADFPVMMPYGYRTSHMFSTKRGYVDFGLGTQLNMTANAGYRVIDEANSSLSLWTQHSSTWNGKNTSPVMKGLSDVLKQKFNDNIFGADFKQAFDKGDLDLGAWIRLDNFNYYGTKPLTPTIEGFVLYDPASWNYINEKDQTFIAFNAHGIWDSKATISDHDISYNISAGYDYAGYNRSVFQQYKGIKEHSLNLRGLATFMIDDDMSFGADARFDYVNRNTPSTTADYLPIKRDYGVITLAPFYNYDNGKVNAELGVIVNFSMGDGAAIRLAPNALVSANVASGLTLYANATGGKTLNTTAKMAQENRYFDPMGHYKNSYTAVDAEAGAKIGPFKGFSMKLFAGYGIFKHDLNSFIPYSFENGIVPDDIETSYLNTFINPTNATAAIYLVDLNTQGVKVGGEINYKYRSIAELNVAVTYAPSSDVWKKGKYNRGYAYDFAGADWNTTINLKVNPIKHLTIDAGLEMHTNRSSFAQQPDLKSFVPIDMNDILNLTLGGSYHITPELTGWVKAANLLNKQWDWCYGMGAQKLNVMVGFGYVF